MPPTRSHIDCRGLVCACCGEKGSNLTDLTDGSALLGLVNSYVSEIYSPKLVSNPIGLCNYCKTNLYKLKKGENIKTEVFHSWIINQERLKLFPRYRGKNLFRKN